MMKVAAVIVSLFIVAQCSTTPEPEATTDPTSKSTTVVPVSSLDPTTRGPHTHDEHPPNDLDHSDHPGHEVKPISDEKTKEELDHHKDGHTNHDQDGHKDHDHGHDDDHGKEESKPEEKTTTAVESNEDHEKRFQRDVLKRRFD